MNEFPSDICVLNKDNFSEYNYNRLLGILRADIYNHMLWRNENDFFDFDKFYKLNFKTKDIDMLDKMKIVIMEELNKIGWNTKLSFGSSALFIYSSENPPSSCW